MRGTQDYSGAKVRHGPPPSLTHDYHGDPLARRTMCCQLPTFPAQSRKPEILKVRGPGSEKIERVGNAWGDGRSVEVGHPETQEIAARNMHRVAAGQRGAAAPDGFSLCD